MSFNDTDLKVLMPFKDHSCLQGKQQDLVIILQILWNLEDAVQFHQIIKAVAWPKD